MVMAAPPPVPRPPRPAPPPQNTHQLVGVVQAVVGDLLAQGGGEGVLCRLVLGAAVACRRRRMFDC
jgi:hypothetical protein